MVFIYTLLLEKNKYYIGKTNNPVFRLSEHFDNKGSAWTEIFKPIKILELIPNCDNYDEDKYVLKYMDMHGIDNVRGGSFSRYKLSIETIKQLQKMSISSNDKCFKCGKQGHFSGNCYVSRKKKIKKKVLVGNVVCFKCGSFGHYSTYCKKSKTF
jgi:hypothetical protein